MRIKPETPTRITLLDGTPSNPYEFYFDTVTETWKAVLRGTTYEQASGGGAIEAADLPTGIDAAKIADGTVTNAEFQYLNGATSNIQSQIDNLDADDIDDAATTNKFTTAADIAKLAAIEAGAQVNDVTSVNGDTGAVVLTASDFYVDGSANGSNPDGTAWGATATVVALSAGGVFEDERTFAAPSGATNGHTVTLVNVSGGAATIKGVTGGDITLADDTALQLVRALGAWYRMDFTA